MAIVRVNPDYTPSDSGWLALPLAPGFEEYSSAQAPKYRKVGKVVQVVGSVKNTSQLGANAETRFATLPAGFRPHMESRFICQGSGTARWMLSITAGGNMNIQRYGTTANEAVPARAWLTFSATFLV